MKYDLKLSSIVKENEAGFTLLEYLTNKFTYKNSENWDQLISSGSVTVNKTELKSDYALKSGDTVEFVIKDFEEPDLNCNFKIEYENENIIIVSKPSDLPVQATRRIFRQTLTGLIREKYGNNSLNPIHRLDRETSGLIIYLKKRYESGPFRKNPLNLIKAKFYIAVLNGYLGKDTVEVNLPLTEANNGIVNYKMIPSDKGLEAKSIFYRIAEYNDKTLALIRILTGRKHQIRAHASYIGCPIVGDKLYSNDGKYFLLRSQDKLTDQDIKELGAKCHMLHAYALLLNHPENKLITSELISKQMIDEIINLGGLQKAKEKLLNIVSEI